MCMSMKAGTVSVKINKPVCNRTIKQPIGNRYHATICIPDCKPNPIKKAGIKKKVYHMTSRLGVK